MVLVLSVGYNQLEVRQLRHVVNPAQENLLGRIGPNNGRIKNCSERVYETS